MNLLDDDDEDEHFPAGTGSSQGQASTPKSALAGIFSREKVQSVAVPASVPVPIPSAARQDVSPALGQTFTQAARAGAQHQLQRASGLPFQRQHVSQQALPFSQSHVQRAGAQMPRITPGARMPHAAPGLQRAGASVAARVPGLQRAGAANAARVQGFQRAGAPNAARVQSMQRAGVQNAAIAGSRLPGMQRAGAAMAAGQAGRFPGMQRTGAGMASVAGGRMAHPGMAGGNGFPRGGLAATAYARQAQPRGVPGSGPPRAAGKGTSLSAHALIIFFQNLRRFVSAPAHAKLVERYSKTRISKSTEAERRQIVAELVHLLGRQMYIKAITFSKTRSKDTSKKIMNNLKKFGTQAQWRAISEKLKKFIAAGNSAPEDVLQRILQLLNQTDQALLKKCTDGLRSPSKKPVPQQQPLNKAGLKPLPVAATSQPVYPNPKKRKASTSSVSKAAKAKKNMAAASPASAKDTPSPKKGKKATPSSAKSSAATGKKRPYKKRKKSDASAKGSAAKKPKISKTKALEIEAQLRRQRKLEKRLAKQQEEARKKEEKQRLKKLRREEKLQAQKKKKKLALAKRRKEALQLSRRYASEASKNKSSKSVKGKSISPSRQATAVKPDTPPKPVLKVGAAVFQDLFDMPPVKRFGSGISLDAPNNALLSGNVVFGKFDETVIRYNKQFLTSADAGSKMLKLVSTQQSRGVMAKYLLTCVDHILKESATNLVGLYLHRKLGEEDRKPLTYADSIHPRLDHQARINALKDNLYTASEKVKLLAEAQSEKATGSFKKMSEIHDSVLRQRQKLKRELLKKEKENPGGVRAEVMRERAEAVKQYKEDSAKAQNAWKMRQPVSSSQKETKDSITINDLLTHFQQGNKLSRTLWSMF